MVTWLDYCTKAIDLCYQKRETMRGPVPIPMVYALLGLLGLLLF